MPMPCACASIYRRQGRLATTVEAKAVDRGEGRVDVVYVIREGEVTKVDSISFIGNRAFSPSQLRDVISTSQSGWLDIFKSAAFYDPERIDRDKELLRRHYLKNGFPDARVRAAEAVKNEEGTGYGITFTIEEGERYVFGAVIIQLQAARRRHRRAAIHRRHQAGHHLQPGDRRQVGGDADPGAQRSGPRLRPRQSGPETPAGGRIMDIGFLIEEGPRVHVERIDIVGNKKTKDFVIRREFRIAEGEPVNAFLIERGRKRVRALGFFKSVDVTHKTGSAPDQMVLTIEVVEDESNNLSFGVGYSMAEGVVGDISLTERNFLGNGQWLRLNLAGSLTRLQADIGFTEPRFLGTNLAAGFDLFYKDVDYTTQASYKSQKIGGSLRLGYPINEQWSTGVNYTFVRNKIYDVGIAASAAIKEAVPGFPDATSNTYYTSSVGYSLAYDTRDNKKRPTSGVYYTVAQDLAGARRRRALRPLGRRGARLLRGERRRDRHGPGDRRHHHGLGRPGRAPARPLLPGRGDGARLCHRRHRAARHPERQSGRAGRAACTTAPPPSCCSRFPACRTTSACAAPCSPMPARSGASTARVRACRALPATPRRCAPPSAWVSPGIPRSATCGSTTPSRS